MAQQAGRASVDMFTVRLFEGKEIDDEEAYVVKLMANGVLVHVPKCVALVGFYLIINYFIALDTASRVLSSLTRSCTSSTQPPTRSRASRRRLPFWRSLIASRCPSGSSSSRAPAGRACSTSCQAAASARVSLLQSTRPRLLQRLSPPQSKRPMATRPTLSARAKRQSSPTRLAN